ncbi:phage holin family protein [Sphingomonas sp.]|uniref:phage holin family protein n=1 Tax=Sphingomonas sp. TaxID=28214 RepID=UPI002CCC49FE|nr:phage holin family protein [Sphingomonas sp.]HWK36313.1 phage holin family protein [Sphingomonas sp.]
MAEGNDGDEPLGTLFAQLTDDARDYAAAEFVYFRELAITKAKDLRDAAVLGAFALLFAFAALVAIAVGAVMALAPMIGAGVATAVVGVVTLVLSGIFGWLAWARVAALLEPDE